MQWRFTWYREFRFSYNEKAHILFCIFESFVFGECPELLGHLVSERC